MNNSNAHRMPRPRSGLRVFSRALLVGVLLSVTPAVASAQDRPLEAGSDVAAAAAAQDAPKEKQPHSGVSAILGLLDWGATAEQVLGTLKDGIDERYGEQLKETTDPIEIDRLLKKKAEEFKSVEQTYVRFTGERTGYETSIIEREYEDAQDESVLRIDRRDAQHYYFFKHERLWKILVAYHAGVTRRTGFNDFVGSVGRKYGQPLKVDWHTPLGGAREVRLAVWEDDLTQLSVENRTDFFGTFTMKFVDRKEGLALDQQRAEAAGKADPLQDPGVEATLLAITEDNGGGGADVVDQVTGQNHDVNLQRGRPEYERLNRAAQPGPYVEEEEEDRGAKQRKPARRAPKKKDKKKADEPFIVY